MAKKVDVVIDDDGIEDVAEAEEEQKAEKAPKEKKVKEKKEKKPKEPKKQKGGGLKVGAVIGVVAALLVIGALVGIVGFNLFGIRDKYLSGIISNTPILNNIIKTGKEEEAPPVDVNALYARIAELQAEGEAKDSTIKSLNENVDSLKGQLAPLLDMEKRQVQFKTDKEAFDREVALGNPVDFAKWYALIDPENAETLYKEAVVINAADKEVSDYMSKIKGMNSKNVAAALEELMKTDMVLVIKILKRFDSGTANEVMNAMKAQSVADILTQMEPKGF